MAQASDSTLTRPLEQGERNYRALFDQSAVAMAQIDGHTGRFVLINQFHCDLLGYTVDEMLQRDWQSIVHPDDRSAHLDDMDRVRGGTLSSFQMDKRYLRKGGAPVWVHLTVVPLWAPGAAPDCYLAIAENIDDRKRAEQELRRAEEALRQNDELFSLALSTAQAGAWDLDLTDHSARHSLQHDRIFGYRELLPRWTYEMFLEHVIPEDREPVDRKLRDAIAHGSDWKIECRILRRDGEMRWISVVGQFRPKERDQPARIAGIVQDVTERKMAEEGLRDSEERFRTMANAIPQLAWITGPTGYVQWFNRRWYEYTGTTPEQVEGWGWQSVLDPAVLPSVLERWRVCIETAEPFDMVVPIRGADGVLRPFLTRILPSKNAKGQVIQWFGTNTDITERIRAEDELRCSRQRIEEANRSKSEFLAMLSHELRNPLEPIRNCLFILERAPPGGEQACRAQRVIERQVQQLTRLVDDLLDVTRLSRGKVRLQLEPLDLADLVRRAVEDHREELRKRDLELQSSVPDERIPIVGDRARIAQVMGNLLTNAAKFTQPGGTVLLAVEVDEPLRQAVARVRDTGPGIAPEMLPHVFEMFTQADATLDRSKGGLGLGLALVKGIVEMHGGTVSAESEGLGTGATFTVRFPLADLQREAEHALGARPSVPRRRVLVIEDNVDAAESLREALELMEITVDVAFSGAEGLERARAFRPEVVLCDIGLPGMDGYAVARAIRAEPALESVALAALTGYAGPEDIERSRRAGFDVVVAKPASLERIEQILREPPRGARVAGA